jgi:hypothetical protein
MANFLFNPIKVQMLGAVGLKWTSDQIVGVLYDSRLTMTPDTPWATISSFVVSTSENMTGRSVSVDGKGLGDTLHFTGVTTQPGLRIVGMLLKFVTGNVPIMNFTDGLDGFSGNSDISLEAEDLEIFARTSAANNSAWIAL